MATCFSSSTSSTKDSILALKKEEPEIFWTATACFLIVLIYNLIWMPASNMLYKARLDEATSIMKQRLHLLQLALERYATDTEGGIYPPDFDELIECGYLNEYPPNPFYGLIENAPQRMMQVKPGESVPGAFVYLVSANKSGYALLGQGWWGDLRDSSSRNNLPDNRTQSMNILAAQNELLGYEP